MCVCMQRDMHAPPHPCMRALVSPVLTVKQPPRAASACLSLIAVCGRALCWLSHRRVTHMSHTRVCVLPLVMSACLEQEAATHGAEGWRVLDELAAAASGSIVTRKAVEPTEAEVAANPRSRSAKLRVFQKAGGAEASSSSGSGAGSRGLAHACAQVIQIRHPLIHHNCILGCQRVCVIL